MHDYDATRRSWNFATRNHNAHKGDQAAFLRDGGDTLFPEELGLLGGLTGRRLVHLQCNSGQDSLCLARRGARVTGVDMSDEAIDFARRLSKESGIAAGFERAEVVTWMHETQERFDLAFCSYGVTGWLPDLDAWADGLRRIVAVGGRFVYVEFHPIFWSVGATRDDYFATEPFVEPVPDYVATSGAALGAAVSAASETNTVAAHAWQHGLGEIVDALLRHGFRLDRLREYPYANGCRLDPSLVPAEGRRWQWPPGVARTPLMFSLAATRA
jgi:SAM-dependent methyltransferase